MSGLSYVGPTPTDARDIETRTDTEDILNTGIDRNYVVTRVQQLVATRAAKAYVDAQDNLYATASYVASRDALLVPNAARGAAAGVATLTSANPPKVTPAQVPVLGNGILKGPWGPNQVFGGTTMSIPLKVAQWNLGVVGSGGQPFAFMGTSIVSAGGRPVLEIRIGTSTQTAYADQTLIAQGFGRSQYSDYQIVTAIPVTAVDGEGQDGVQDAYTPSTNYLVNAWVYDGAGGTVTTNVGSITSAALFLARTAL